MDVETGVFHSLIPKLFDLRQEMLGLPKTVRIDLTYISNELSMVEAVLEDQSRRARGDQQDQQFKHEVRKLSFDIEIFIDKFGLFPNPTLEGFEGLMEKMGGFLKKGKTSHQIFASELKRIKAQLEIIAKLRDSLMNDSVDRPAALQDLYPQVKDLVGIDGKKDQELIKLLSDGDNASNKKLKIICVVGLGGLGKTTLVKAVYAKIGGRFDCKAFVPVGQNADAKKVFRDMISQLTTGNSYSNTCTPNEQELLEKLQEILENKRYLIVIEDIWDENLGEIIKDAFSTNNNLGSRVIITTRIVNVSKAFCSSGIDSIYQMEALSDDDSRKLLYAEIFGSASKCPQEFEQVSIDILNNCGGVPIAIITMASVLAGNPQMQTWHDLLKPTGYEFAEECLENMKIIMSFSSNDLPAYLKTCLVYMSTFPEGHPIETDRLVKQWIAEGIVSRWTNQKHFLYPEEVASMHVNKLIHMNAIHPLECNKNGEVITCHIRPMMHVVLKAIAIKEEFAASLDIKHISRVHRMNLPNLSIHCPDSEILTDLSSMAFDGVFRSLTVFGHASRFLLRHFDGIRFLDLEGCKSIERADVEYICSMVLLKRLCLAKTQITDLPPEIGKLQYLEGLDVGGTQITQLPPQIVKLQRLKTLDARKSGVKDLPDEVVQLTRLVNLLIGDNESCEGVKLPDGIGKMTSLQQLGTIDLRKCSASSLKELGELPNLKYIAVVSSDEPEDTTMNIALLCSLDKSTELRSLVVYSDFRLSALQSSSLYKCLNCRKKLTVVRRSLKVPTGIAEHHFLGMLDVRVCKLEEEDLKILRELPRLHSLIVRLEVLPTKMIRISCQGFAKLVSFYMDCRMPRVTFEEGAMPKLENLELKLYGGTTSEEHMGIKHLRNLQKVTLRYAKWYATNKGVRETTEAVKTECKEHQNEITLCVTEEEKGGKCIPKTQIFQENRVASSSKMTEIGKQEDTQDGGLHQRSHDVASCSQSSEIEEVVE